MQQMQAEMKKPVGPIVSRGLLGVEKYVKVTLHGGRSYVQPLSELHNALNGELDGAEIGSKWTLELVEMTPEEYERMDEFTGH